MKKHVNVLGARYTITRLPAGEMPEGYGGFCDSDLRRIKILRLSTLEEWRHETKEKCEAREKLFLRHEIVHAFFDESGLRDSSERIDIPWPRNEELVDWLAIQGEKIYKAWEEAEAL